MKFPVLGFRSSFIFLFSSFLILSCLGLLPKTYTVGQKYFRTVGQKMFHWSDERHGIFEVTLYYWGVQRNTITVRYREERLKKQTKKEYEENRIIPTEYVYSNFNFRLGRSRIFRLLQFRIEVLAVDNEGIVYRILSDGKETYVEPTLESTPNKETEEGKETKETEKIEETQQEPDPSE